MGALIAPAAARIVGLYLAGSDLLLGLFLNDHVPDPIDFADGRNYVEPTWPTYARVALVPAGVTIEEPGTAYRDFLPVAWTPPAGAAGWAAGVFVWNQGEGRLEEGIPFPLPVQIEPGVPIRANPRFRVRRLT